jgi:adenine-specific DNA-methyltransferase
MARKKTTSAQETDVGAIRHQDTRKNIPTEELRDFVAEEETAPKKMLYPRDPSLDPQLVWKGKDEQDRQDLAVEVVPVYIQEAIEPRAIIQVIQSRPKTVPETAFFPGFYDDLNQIDFAEKIEFYRHERRRSMPNQAA